MKVTIWDLDYYHAKRKVNCFNPDAMKISSYHKQLGDSINFVTKQDDIYRPYDLYYIIKEKPKTPQPPIDFIVNPKVRWWGKAYRAKINWKMNDVMLGCRPDYLLYPERNTKMERGEHIRLFNNNAELLPQVQEWRNTFTNKYAIVTDPYMWFADKNSIIQALKVLQEAEKISFLEPIWLQKLLSYKEIKEEFLKLKFAPGSLIQWTNINFAQVEDAILFIREFKEYNPHVSPGKLILDYRDKNRSHWDNKKYALEDFEALKKLIIRCKEEMFNIEVRMPANRFETPYFFLFEELARWTKYNFTYSWLEYLSDRCGKVSPSNMPKYWNSPGDWSETFRDLLRQTWTDTKFLLLKNKDNYVSENDIPWKLWEKEFSYGI